MATPYEVPRKKLEKIFEDRIVPLVFGETERFAPGEKPVLVQLIGQLAAGKSTALGNILNQYPGRMAEVSPDQYRTYHPQYKQIMRERPHEMVALTNEAMWAWSDMVRDYAHAESHGLVVEGTGRNPDYLSADAQHMAASTRRHPGFHVETWVVATAEEVSSKDMVGRYLASSPGRGRWADSYAHDQMFAQLPHTVEVMEQDPSVARVVITDREGTLHYDNTRGPDGAWLQNPRGAQALREARHEGKVPLDQPQGQEWMASYWQHNRALIERGELNSQTAPTMLRLYEHADRIAPVAHHGQDDHLHQHTQKQTVQKAVLLAGERGAPNADLPPTPEAFLNASPPQKQDYLQTMQHAGPAEQEAVHEDAADAARRAQQGQAPPGVQNTRAESSRHGPDHGGDGRNSGLDR